eukprot:Stramenopile-MAST_4_protein_257
MSCLDFGKELEQIQGRVQDAVGKFQSETYTIDERAKEGGYFVDIAGNEQDLKSANVLEDWKPENITRDNLNTILQQHERSSHERKILISESYDLLQSIVPPVTRTNGKTVVHDDPSIQLLDDIPYEYLQDERIEDTVRPALEEKQKLLQKFKIIALGQQRLRKAAHSHIAHFSEHDSVFRKIDGENQSLKERLAEQNEKYQQMDQSNRFLKMKVTRFEGKLQQLEEENKIVSEALKKMTLRYEMEREAVGKHNVVQSKLSMAEAKLEKMAAELEEKNLQQKRARRNKVEKSHFIPKSCPSASPQQETLLKTELISTKRILFQTETAGKNRAKQLNEKIAELEEMFECASKTILDQKAIISRMEGERANAEENFAAQKKDMAETHKFELQSLETKITRKSTTISVGTYTEVSETQAFSRPSSSGLVSSIALRDEDMLKQMQLAFMSSLQKTFIAEYDELDPQKFLSLIQSIILGISRSLHERSILLGMHGENGVFDKLIQFTVQFASEKFNDLVYPFATALNALPKLFDRMATLENELKAQELVQELAFPNRIDDINSNRTTQHLHTVSQASAQLQTDSVLMVGEKTQTDERQCRDIGIQAYFSVGLEFDCSDTRKDLPARQGWSFLTSDVDRGWSLQGHQLTANRMDPTQLRKSVIEILRQVSIKEENNLRLTWKHFVSQYVVLQFWKNLCERVLPANEKDNMDSAQILAMSHWQRRRTLCEKRSKQTKEDRQDRWKHACDVSLELVKNIAGKNERVKRMLKADNLPKPKKSPWDRESARHKSIWQKDLHDPTAKSIDFCDAWSAVKLSFHPIDFSAMGFPTNYIKVSNIHKFNKPHFDPRKLGGIAQQKPNTTMTILGEKAGVGLETTKENTAPAKKQRPTSARVLKKKTAAANAESAPPLKKSSEVGVTTIRWAEPVASSRTATITMMKGVSIGGKKDKNGKRASNTYGKSKSRRRSKRNVKVTAEDVYVK